jgi:putative transposase
MRKPYPSDLTDAQWEIIRPLIPVNPVGRPRVVDLREVLNSILYLIRSGCQWDLLPHDLLPKSTVYDDFAQWRDDGTWQNILDALRQKVRVAAGKEPAPSAMILDSQTVKGSEVGGERGDDGGKKINGVKRQIVVDTLGLLIVVLVTAAGADDGTTAPEVLERLKAEHTSRWERVWADSTYRNHRLDGWLKDVGARYRIEIVSRPAGSKGFGKLPRRWVVERTFGGLGRYRRNSRDDEWYPQSSEAVIRVSSIHRMLRLLSPDESRKQAPFKYPKPAEKITG